MASIKSIGTGVLGTVNLLLSMWTFYRLIIFLSFSHLSEDVVNGLPCCGQVVWPVLWNTLLLNLFVLQHTLMKSNVWKERLLSAGVNATYCRLLYSFSSCVSLLLFMSYSVPLFGPVVWYYDSSEYPILALAVNILHFTLWIAILLAILLRDPFELVGLKPPLDSCDASSERAISWELTHQRHVGLVAFILILWISTTMTVERFLVAIIFTLYIVLGNDAKLKVV